MLDPAFSLDKKITLVVGAANGIGRATALAYAAAGAAVACADVEEPGLKTTVADIEAALLPAHRDATHALAGVRPESVEIVPLDDATLRGTVSSALRLPVRDTMLLTVRAGAHEIHAQIAGGASVRLGDSIGLRFTQYHLFDKASGERLQSHRLPS